MLSRWLLDMFRNSITLIAARGLAGFHQANPRHELADQRVDQIGAQREFLDAYAAISR
jgi:hypothetical protein